MDGLTFRSAIRTLTRRSVFSLITIGGLAVGFACCMLIVWYIRYELSFDQFHLKKDRIQWLSYHFQTEDRTVVSPSVPEFVGPKFKGLWPEIENQCRVLPSYRRAVVKHGDRLFEETKLIHADASFFNLFSFSILRGNRNEVLSLPNTIVLTQSAALRYFGNADPVGQTLLINNAREYTVTGIAADPPANSHFSFDFVASMASLNPANIEVWDSPNYVTYLLLSPSADASVLQAKIDRYLDQKPDAKVRISVIIHPLEQLHFDTAMVYGWFLQITNPVYLTIFGMIAAGILFIACLNYANLSVAIATERTKEIGIRKSIGAGRLDLFRQFIAESLLVVVPATVIAFGLVELSLPLINQSLRLHMPEHVFDSPELIVYLGVLAITVGLIAAIYPALIIAGMEPVNAIKNKKTPASRRWSLRSALLVAQFFISINLIVGTLVIQRQINFLLNTPLGYDREAVVMLPVDKTIREQLPALQHALAQLPDITSVSAASNPPTNIITGYGFLMDETSQVETVAATSVDTAFLGTLGISLKVGRNFRSSDLVQSEPKFLVNESFLKHFSLTPADAIGKKVILGLAGKGEIVGVIGDFHLTSLYQEIDPLVLTHNPTRFEYVLIKLAPGPMSAHVQKLESVWKQFVTHRPFEFRFLDDAYSEQYQAEKRTSAIVNIFSAIAIGIACLGLYGLVSFSLVQRTKEIGIRKVLGASLGQLILTLSGGYAQIVAVAFVLAIPSSYMLMHQWLQNFAYRITIEWSIFFLAAAGLLLVMILTMGYRIYKAATANPVEALKYE